MCGHYSRYISSEINTIVGKKLIRIDDLDYYFFASGLSIQNVFAVLSIVFIAIVNLALISPINTVLTQMDEVALVGNDLVQEIRIAYWVLLSVLAIVSVTSIAYQFTIKVRNLPSITSSINKNT